KRGDVASIFLPVREKPTGGNVASIFLPVREKPASDNSSWATRGRRQLADDSRAATARGQPAGSDSLRVRTARGILLLLFFFLLFLFFFFPFSPSIDRRWPKSIKLTAVVTKAIRFHMPFAPIRESKIAAKTCRDLNPFLPGLATRTGGSLTPFRLKLSPFSLDVVRFEDSSDLGILLQRCDCMYATVPPATKTADTAANVLLLNATARYW
ncbi:hypothetical protein BHE74_00056730, partial [Ensete ventricosum]